MSFHNFLSLSKVYIGYSNKNLKGNIIHIYVIIRGEY